MYEMRCVCKSSKASQQPQTWLNRKAVWESEEKSRLFLESRAQKNQKPRHHTADDDALLPPGGNEEKIRTTLQNMPMLTKYSFNICF